MCQTFDTFCRKFLPNRVKLPLYRNVIKNICSNRSKPLKMKQHVITLVIVIVALIAYNKFIKGALKIA